MSRPHRPPAPALLLIVLGACRGSSQASAVDAGAPDVVVAHEVASCDRSSTAGTCSEYDGVYLTAHESLVTASCQRLGGTFHFAACPNTSNVGGCRLPTGEGRQFYATGAAAYDADGARKECESSLRGTWAPR